MKCDSSLLNQRKPFFLPDWSEDIRMTPCTVVRICRLGRCIQPKFAARYYDAIADGINFRAADMLTQGKWNEAFAFDASLCVGLWREPDGTISESIHQAIADVSRFVTIRIGDLVFVDAPQEAQHIETEQIIEKDGLYCKIK